MQNNKKAQHVGVPVMLDPSIFFNCCNGLVPNWSEFSNLILTGCRYMSQGYVDPCVSYDDAEFFLISAGDGLEAWHEITGTATIDEAKRVGLILSNRSGLKLLDNDGCRI